MPVIAIEDIPAMLKPGYALAGLDLGTKTMGLAVSDAGLRLAVPRQMIPRRKFSLDCERLTKFFSDETVGAMVIGLPINMDGREGPRAQSTRAFARNLATRTPIPLCFWDERLSTVAAERALLEMDVSRGKRAGRIDSAAPAFILQGVLDRLRASGGLPVSR